MSQTHIVRLLLNLHIKQIPIVTYFQHCALFSYKIMSHCHILSELGITFMHQILHHYIFDSMCQLSPLILNRTDTHKWLISCGSLYIPVMSKLCQTWSMLLSVTSTHGRDLHSLRVLLLSLSSRHLHFGKKQNLTF